ncbi:MAG: 4-hydroxy-tetrahydrodipicolinate reductase [Bacteroidetes bacterium HGW-Bacteroidetes-4]|jgi:4-hydroxy-tetrahydrodipicolinate reductase|nr:MAG: 4-hydroxy-tetrahydrodipicolinate reductase [Bacteroidetes bacterium HGW-Bacteroidetes-4]
MNIALIGYGKMGKAIEAIALSRGHTIGLIIDHDNQAELNPDKLREIDVCIEFSKPESAVDNYLKCFESGVPVVSGTTGWLDQLDELIKKCENLNAGFFYASNFSLGVNLFFELNRKLVQLMQDFPEYSASITEIHHTKKLDAPSGTAITLAESILAAGNRYTAWKNQTEVNENELPIISFRQGEVPGTHEVIYNSPIDTLSIKHEAKSREGFALGAVLAAEFMKGKTGCFGMNDLLKLG